MELIGLVGLKGSGKDTVGLYFEQQYGFSAISFADSLKDCVCAIFGWDRTMMEGRTPKSRLWREQNDPWWAEKLGLPFFSPRDAMTGFGTDVMRKHFHSEIWVYNTERKIKSTFGPVVVTDIRFPNELEMIRGLGGKIIRVERGEQPYWHETALRAINGDQEAIDTLQQNKIHESEWRLINTPTDTVLHNNSSISSLYEECERWYSEHSGHEIPSPPMLPMERLVR
jgi:hypothetical protein